MKKTLIALLAVGVFFSYFEIPAPRYSELNDYPSIIATELEVAIKFDPSLSHAELKVLRAWHWRWGRYGAGLQIWGIQNQSQQQLIVQHLNTIKSKIGIRRFIRAELWSGYPGVPPHTSSEPENVVILKAFSS